MSECLAIEHNSSFNEVLRFEIAGQLNVSLLETALKRIISRHSLLKCKVNMGNNVMFQVTDREITDYFKVSDVLEKQLDEALDLETNAEFNIETGPLFRMHVFQMLEKSIMQITFHHIICDGWSMGLIAEELSEIYTSLLVDREVVLEPAFEFKEYLEQSSRALKDSVIKEAQQYWFDRCIDGNSNISIGYSDNWKIHSNAGKRNQFSLDKAFTEKIRKCAVTNQTSVFNLLLSSFYILLSKLSGEEKFFIGIPFAMQGYLNMYKLVGNCSRILPIEIALSKECKIRDIYHSIQQQMKQLENINYILPDEIADQNVINSPKINIVFNVDKLPQICFGTEKAKILLNRIEQVKYDIFLNFIDYYEYMAVSIDYRAELFNDDLIHEWKEYFIEILSQIIDGKNYVNTISLKARSQGEILFEELSKLNLSMPKYLAHKQENIKFFVVDKQKMLQPLGVLGDIYVGVDEVEIYKTHDKGFCLPDHSLVVVAPEEKIKKIQGRYFNLKYLEEIIKGLSNVEEVSCKLKNGTIECILKTEGIIDSNWLYYEISKICSGFSLRFYTQSGDSLHKVHFKQEQYTETEEQIYQIYKQALKTEYIGKNVNFFDLGGDSLKAYTLVVDIENQFGIRLSIADIYQYSTIGMLSERIEFLLNNQKEKIEKRKYLPKFHKIKETNIFKASPGQKRMYLIHQQDPRSLSYNVTFFLSIEGQISFEKMQGAFSELIMRHEILRTNFIENDDDIFQKINVKLDFQLQYDVLAEEKNSEKQIEQEARLFASPFNLEEGALIRAKLIRINEYHSYLIVDIHHSIFDGGSFDVFLSELIMTYYNKKLDPVPYQYKDYVDYLERKDSEWDRSLLKNFWKEQFNQPLNPLKFSDWHFTTSINLAANGSSLRNIKFSNQKSQEIKEFCIKLKITPFVFFLSVFHVLLAKYGGEKDIVFGVPVEGRNEKETRQMIGMFVNTVPIRIILDDKYNISEFLRYVQEVSNKCIDNGTLQMEDIIETINDIQNTNGQPIFEVMFTYQNNCSFEYENDKLKIIGREMKNPGLKSNIVLEAMELNNHIELNIEYSLKVFGQNAAARMVKHIVHLTDCFLSDPELTLSKIELITEEEKEQILKQFNSSFIKFDSERLLHQVFEEQVKRSPNTWAVCESERRVTYQELLQLAEKFENKLIQKSVKAGDVIGVFLDKSIELMAAIVGILKVGGIYMPLDKKLPDQRLKYMIEDSNCSCVITDCEERFDQSIETVLIGCLNEEPGQIQYNPKEEIRPDNPAYLIYTSGTTGKPKGVLVSHRNLLNSNETFRKYYRAMPEERIALFASIGFDASISEIFMGLLNSASLYIPEQSVIEDIMTFEEYLIKERISIITLPPIYLNNINPERPYSIKVLITAGSKTNKGLVDRWKDSCLYINAYGPTEDSICSTIWYASGEEETPDNVPIGRPVINKRVYILDENRNLLPVGVTGEIVLGGEGVSLGYLNRPEINKEKFIPNPVEDIGRAYCTGDYGRWKEDGNIEFLGRKDRQLKIRGVRVEADEIEHVLLEIPEVKDAVILGEEEDEETILTAYLVCRKQVKIQVIRNYLKEKLPLFMIPVRFTILDSIPLTLNGKVDEKALCKMNSAVDSSDHTKIIKNEKVWDVFKSIFKDNTLDLQRSFFDLGGDSIKGMRIISRLKKLGYETNIALLFYCDTLEDYINGLTHK